jgi:4-hydroxy-tetrahydrodipicolinate synthase
LLGTGARKDGLPIKVDPLLVVMHDDSLQVQGQGGNGMSFEPLTGIVAAPLLPMHPDTSIDWETVESYMAWIAGQGPAAIAVNMDSSEVSALRRDEQLELVRVTRRAVGGACPVYSGIFAGSTAEATSFGLKLKLIGAQGIVVFPPFPTFLGLPLPAEMVFEYHRAIAEGVDLPMIAFQFPKGVGPEFPPETLAELVKLSQFIGLKEASFDTVKTVDTIEAAAALPRKISILTGSDSFILEAIIMGCDGALIGLAGTAVREQVEMHRLAAQHDYQGAMVIWERLRPLARFTFRAPNRDYRARLKELLVMQGLFRSAVVRPPLLAISAAERAEVRRLAIEAGILDQPALRAVAGA